MQRDNQIFDIIDREHLRQRRGIELIASENFVSDEVMRAMGSCLTNKYAEGYPGKRYYGGCQVVDEAENLAIERAKKLFGAEWANVQPHSGAQANMAVFMACLNAGDTFMGMDLSHGGHLSHGSPVNFSGLMFRPISYTVDKETGRVNYDEMETKARAERPKLIIAGASAYSRDWDYKRIRALADEIGAIFMVRAGKRGKNPPAPARICESAGHWHACSNLSERWMQWQRSVTTYASSVAEAPIRRASSRAS